MKKTFFLILPAVAICLLFAAACANDQADPGKTSSGPETVTTTQTPETSDKTGTDVTTAEPTYTALDPDLEGAVYSEGVTVLTVAWGSTEDTLKCIPNPDNQWKTGPHAFTVGKGGEIYIYDTHSEKLKVFDKGRFIHSLDFSGVNDAATGISIFAMAEIGDSIYASDYLTNKIFKITGDAIVEMQALKLSHIGKMNPTPNGYITAEGDSKTYIFNAEGRLVYNSDSPIIGDCFVYSGEDGKILYGFDTTEKAGKFRLIDKNSDCLSAVSVATYAAETANDGKEVYTTGADIIGADAQGRVYLCVHRNYSANNTVVTMEDYFIRLDVKNKTVQTMKVPVEADKTRDPMPLRGGGMNDMVTSDGSIYRAVMTTDNGVRIVRFTFD